MDYIDYSEEKLLKSPTKSCNVLLIKANKTFRKRLVNKLSKDISQ